MGTEDVKSAAAAADQQTPKEEVTLLSIMEKLDSMQKEMRSGFAPIVDSLQQEINSTRAEMQSGFARIENALPAAAPVPKVYVSGDKKNAQKKGASSTWTIVKARKETLFQSNSPAPSPVSLAPPSTPSSSKSDAVPVPVSPYDAQDSPVEKEDPYLYFLVSTAHSIKKIEDFVVTNDNGEDDATHSLIFLCDDAKSDLMQSSDDWKQDVSPGSESSAHRKPGSWSVERVGFHRKAMNPGTHNYHQHPELDIVFFQLTGKPQLGEDYEIPEVEPMSEKEREAFTRNANVVSGTALRGRVNGERLLYGFNEYTFVANFLEASYNGTVMFGFQNDGGRRCLGVFQGTTEKFEDLSHSRRARGRVVPFPMWDQVSWVNCKSRGFVSLESSFIDLPHLGGKIARGKGGVANRKAGLVLDRIPMFSFSGTMVSASVESSDYLEDEDDDDEWFYRI